MWSSRPGQYKLQQSSYGLPVFISASGTEEDGRKRWTTVTTIPPPRPTERDSPRFSASPLCLSAGSSARCSTSSGFRSLASSRNNNSGASTSGYYRGSFRPLSFSPVPSDVSLDLAQTSVLNNEVKLARTNTRRSSSRGPTTASPGSSTRWVTFKAFNGLAPPYISDLRFWWSPEPIWWPRVTGLSLPGPPD